MKKLHLAVGELRVESYPTAPAGGARDTVAAAQAASGHPDCTQVYLCTLQSCGVPVCTV
jgi:hypothetical protein